MSNPVLIRERAPSFAATRTATLAVTELPAWLGVTYGRIAQCLSAAGRRPAGPPFARYHRHDNGRFDVTAGFPVDEKFTGDGDVVSEWMPGGRVAVVQHHGSYEAMVPAYRTLAQWLIDHHAVALSDPYEVYRSGPGDSPDPAAQLTDIVQPFRLDPRSGTQAPPVRSAER
jgi:effector-binding domain-containing protein